MSSPAVLLEAYIDAFNRYDIEGMLAVLSDDVEHEINEGGTERGVAAFRAFKLKMAEHYREHLDEVVIFENGDRGAAEFRCSGEYLKTDAGLPEATGQRYAIPAAIFVRTAGGKITRMTSYYNLNGWMEAVR